MACPAIGPIPSGTDPSVVRGLLPARVLNGSAATDTVVKRDPVDVGRQLHNVTLYVARKDFERVSAFYRAAFGTEPIWAEPGHIACFGTAELALRVHEEDGEHPPGTQQLYFWHARLDHAEAGLSDADAHVRRVPTPDGDDELRAADQYGNVIRVHRRRDERPSCGAGEPSAE